MNQTRSNKPGHVQIIFHLFIFQRQYRKWKQINIFFPQIIFFFLSFLALTLFSWQSVIILKGSFTISDLNLHKLFYKTSVFYITCFNLIITVMFLLHIVTRITTENNMNHKKLLNVRMHFSIMGETYLSITKIWYFEGVKCDSDKFSWLALNFNPHKFIKKLD